MAPMDNAAGAVRGGQNSAEAAAQPLRTATEHIGGSADKERVNFFRAVFAAVVLIARLAQAPTIPAPPTAIESWLPVGDSERPPAIADRTPAAPAD